MLFRSHSYDVICVGSVSKDLFFPTDEAIILQTPEDITAPKKIAFELGGKYRVADRYEAIGGVAANVATGLTRLGHRAACYSNVGDDELGRWILSEFKREGVSCDLLTVIPETKTDLSAIIVLTQSGERTIFHNRDANEQLRITPQKLKRTSWLFVSALNGEWQSNLDLILEYRASSDVSLALNPGQHNIKEAPDLMARAAAQADVLLLNKDEAIELVLRTEADATTTLLDDEKYLMHTLYRRGSKVIGMTDGRRGAWAFDGAEYWHCRIHPLGTVVDSTGAGDAFGSGFFGAKLSGKSLSEALACGIANSGSVVCHYGASEGLLRSPQMEAILRDIELQRLG